MLPKNLKLFWPFTVWINCSKGQLISKANCQAEDSSKKRTNEFVFTSMRRVCVCFFEESSARKKKRFEIIWPLIVLGWNTYTNNSTAHTVSSSDKIFLFLLGWHTYTHNSTAHTDRSPDKILTVRYEDGAWTKPYYDCGGGNIWMMTYTVPFFGFENGQYVFK